MRTRKGELGWSKVLSLHKLLLEDLRASDARITKLIGKLSAEELASDRPVSLYHSAAAGGSAAAVRALAAAGAPIALANSAAYYAEDSAEAALRLPRERKALLLKGGVALRLAIQAGHGEVVRELLAAGADVNAPARPGNPAFVEGQEEEGTFLELAAKAANVQAVRELLAAGADPNAGAVGPLGLAVEPPVDMWRPAQDVCAVVQELLAAGADAAHPAVLSGLSSLARQPGCTDATRALLDRIPANSAAGGLAFPAHGSLVENLLRVAASLDAVPAFCHFAVVVRRQDLGHEQAHLVLASRMTNAHTLLTEAVQADNAGVLELALASAGLVPPATAAASPEEAAAVRYVCGRFAARWVPQLFSHAVWKGSEAAVRMLLRAGQAVTLQDLLSAISYRRCAVLRALLASGRPAVPVVQLSFLGDAPIVPTHPEYWRYSCPMFAALQQRMAEGHRSALDFLPLVEALAEAGYRPTVYQRVQVRRRLPGGQVGPPQLCERFDPAQEDSGLQLDGANRSLWIVAQGVQWSPAEHARYPQSFQAAARSVLLAAHRLSSDHSAGSSGGGGEPASKLQRVEGAAAAPLAAAPPAPSLGSLPPDLLLRILGQAAHPLSAWVALDEA